MSFHFLHEETLSSTLNFLFQLQKHFFEMIERIVRYMIGYDSHQIWRHEMSHLVGHFARKIKALPLFNWNNFGTVVHKKEKNFHISPKNEKRFWLVSTTLSQTAHHFLLKLLFAWIFLFDPSKDIQKLRILS